MLRLLQHVGDRRDASLGAHFIFVGGCTRYAYCADLLTAAGEDRNAAGETNNTGYKGNSRQTGGLAVVYQKFAVV